MEGWEIGMMISLSYRYAVFAVLRGFLSGANVLSLSPDTHLCGANQCPVPTQSAASQHSWKWATNAQSRLCPFRENKH